MSADDLSELMDRLAENLGKFPDVVSGLSDPFKAELGGSRLIADFVEALDAVLERIVVGLGDRQADPAGWAEFMGEHPELADTGRSDRGRALSDDELLDGVRRAIKESEVHPGAAAARDVAKIVYPEFRTIKFRSYEDRARLGRVGARLGKLSRTGRVVRLRPRYGSGCCLWSLPGASISKRVLLFHEVAMMSRTGGTRGDGARSVAG